jgi:uncharacterized membrane protein YqgA involved in biofilm formation
MIKKLPIGTFINMSSIIVGSLIGIGLQQTFPPNIKMIIFQGIGLATLLIGIQMSLKLPEGYLLILVFSMILGGIMGEMLHIDFFLQELGEYIKATFKIGDEKFTEGLVTAFLLFCVGSMVIIGAIEEGISGKRELLLVKSTLDGVSSIAFASTYGIGVLFSIFPLFIIQGGLTLLARYLQHFFTPTIINMLSAVGGLLIIGIGIKLLDLGQINIENLLPSLLVVVVFTRFYEQWKR